MTGRDDLQDRLADLEVDLGVVNEEMELVITDRIVDTNGEDRGVVRKLRIFQDPADGWQTEELPVNPTEAADR